MAQSQTGTPTRDLDLDWDLTFMDSDSADAVQSLYPLQVCGWEDRNMDACVKLTPPITVLRLTKN